MRYSELAGKVVASWGEAAGRTCQAQRLPGWLLPAFDAENGATLKRVS
jgi:hypothetical protein